MIKDDARLAARLQEHLHPLSGAASDYDSLIERIGDARYVLIGEATHGTHEFYARRADLTQRLIRERGFNLVAAEADWPDAYRVNRYVRGTSRDRDAREALSGFQRFPTWMWRNTVVLAFVRWLRVHNAHSDRPVGFYGIDLYSLHSSIRAVLAYLERSHPDAASEARERYACFDAFGGNPQRYGFAASSGFLPSCEDEVIAQLMELRQRGELTHGLGVEAQDEAFFAEQNARVVKNAEEYYRAMFRGGIASWNLRDTHMADTVDALCRHFGQRDSNAKIVIWAHNSHIGDARATELGAEGELNLGQLMRERHPGQTALIGFSTYEGTVTAASEWDAPAQQKRVRPALPGSYEALFHQTARPAFVLIPDQTPFHEELATARLQRAIGVVYRPQTERTSHYYHARLSDHFDAVLHIDRTRALEPLEALSRPDQSELPETYPSGM